MNRSPKYQNTPFPTFPLVLWWWVKGSSVAGAGSSSRGLWHLGARPAQSQNGCSFVPQRWQTYCIALCTRQTAGSCRAEFKGRPALAAGADWLCSRLVTAGSTAAPLGRPRPLTSVAVGGRTRWRVASCAGRLLPLRARLVPGAGQRKGILAGTFRWAASFRTDFDSCSRQAWPVLVHTTPYRVFSWTHSWNSYSLLENSVVVNLQIVVR